MNASEPVGSPPLVIGEAYADDFIRSVSAMQDLKAERAFYDELFTRNPENEHITAGYDDLHRLALPAPPDGFVLDLGCGTGAHAIRLARRGCRVVAVDLTLPGVRAARGRFGREGLEGGFVVADAEHLPFCDRSVAVIWSALLLHHFPRLDRLPDELARVTRERVIAFEPNAQNFLTWLAFNVVNPIVGLSTTTRNQRALWPRPLRKVFERHGFGGSDVHYVHLAWRDDAGSMSVVRRVYETMSAVLPLRFRANKFLVVFEKRR